MKTNFKLDTVEVLIKELINSIEFHQTTEKELQKTEPPLFLLGYNRQKIKSMEKTLNDIIKYINK